MLDRALAALRPGEPLRVVGDDPHLLVHLRAWARGRGHDLAAAAAGPIIRKGGVGERRLLGAVRAGDGASGAGVCERAPATWGLAARGALVEHGAPALTNVDLDTRADVWSELAPQLYAQAAAAQWDPATAIDWAATQSLSQDELPDDVEDAVVQVMTYLIENEQAALMVPARFLGRIHPHYREVVQFLATQVADEARHVEVFTRRATLRGRPLGVSGAGGRASLQTLLDEPDWSTASFLLSVLGEGTFLSLLSFLQRCAPDVATAQAARLVHQDEARHVAFALGHLRELLHIEPTLRTRLSRVIVRRHDVLASTAGLVSEVHDALVILAAGAWEPAAIARGWDEVQRLEEEMQDGRRRRLRYLGFAEDDAAELAALHTRNFM